MYYVSQNHFSLLRFQTPYVSYPDISRILSLISVVPTNMGGVFAKYSVQAVAWLVSKKSGLFFGISRLKKIDTVT